MSYRIQIVKSDPEDFMQILEGDEIIDQVPILATSPAYEYIERAVNCHPELLEALRAARERMVSDGYSHDGPGSKVLDMADAAITKAEGGE
jgi:hypothetical protein